MSTAAHRDALTAIAPGAATACVKCAHRNPPAAEDCEKCGARLWVVCQECGTKNRRSEPACSRCNRRLRKAKRSRSRAGGLPEGRVWIGVAVIALLLLALAGLWIVAARNRLPGKLVSAGVEATA